jgi:hypothetical protein
MLRRWILRASIVLAFCFCVGSLNAQLCTRPECSCIVQVASSQIGNCEEGGNNRGYHVEKYLKAVNLGGGYAWCAAFVAWTLDVCGVKHTITAWSPTAVSKNVIWERGNGDEPTSGDVFGLYYPSKGRVGHVGIVFKWGDKYVTTIEGNTNEEGSREGDCVLKKFRHKSVIYRVSRWR